MSVIEYPNDSNLEPTMEFDPVSEIKTLRQSLTQRLQVLKQSESDVSVTNETGFHDTEPEQSTLPILPPLMLVQQISRARQLLSQLQIDPSLSKTKEKKSKKIAVEKNIDWEKIESFFPSLDTLQTTNIVLTWVGFFGLLAGILFSFRYGNDNHVALPIIVAGIAIIIIGCLGRLFLLPAPNGNAGDGGVCCTSSHSFLRP